MHPRARAASLAGLWLALAVVPVARADDELADLPLRVLPARGDAPSADTFAVFMTGDAGWTPLERGIAQELAAHGLTVVGWDSLRYYWRARTPQGAAEDLDRVLRHYAAALRRPRAIVVGYSQGADTVPFLINRLPQATRASLGFAALLAPGAEAFFEFHVSHWFATPRGGTPIAPEIEKLAPLSVLCVYGRDDPDAACHDGIYVHVRSLPFAGGHDFDGEYRRVAASVIEADALARQAAAARVKDL